MSNKIVLALVAGGAVMGVVFATPAQEQGHDLHAQHMLHMQQQADQPPVSDPRPLVHFPDELRIHTLANMRDHLLALQEIQDALAAEAFEKAGDIAEQRLGMSSLQLHGAHDVAQYMPEGMRAIGSEMHRAASRVAVAAKDAAVTGDLKPALAALARVTGQCVACHSGYRVQ